MVSVHRWWRSDVHISSSSISLCEAGKWFGNGWEQSGSQFELIAGGSSNRIDT